MIAPNWIAVIPSIVLTLYSLKKISDYRLPQRNNTKKITLAIMGFLFGLSSIFITYMAIRSWTMVLILLINIAAVCWSILYGQKR
ncbi:hypothetical protein [Tetragenococcus halophilus]|uniref:Uncharacterized protein n=1 Tax=Tetragenococcus halophilus TaxID=51669 RepID=A0AB35HSV5_TETHA|nr:hypothetical protein [Tetragenococcus halophilus]MCF1601122.1 hypothetical protein [Tetragenococcus halophilus]MCO8292202.1 hypothetical protein [Tetragenococcus halophilus]MCO8296779.1 hypothetical protein [Tetragenococcus halophilus]MCO8299252.1 hypothetical protein [Tetragenococcus halophilus]GEQ38919.1 hypothetical protein TH3N_20450 [Tetragenococcus halophilus]